MQEESNCSNKPINPAFVLTIQSIAFTVIGFGLNYFAAADIKADIPLVAVSINPIILTTICGVIGFLLMAFANIGLSYVFINTSKNYRIASITSSKMLKEALDMGKSRVPVLILAAIAEEMLFRYGEIPFIASFIIMLPTQNIEAILIATIISSFLFAGMHFQYGNGLQFVQILLAGFVLAAVFLTSGNIVLTGIVHAAVNILALKLEPKMMLKFKD